MRKKNEKILFIFDLDGTLYKLDGVDGGFKRSTLEKTVLKNALSFIRANENVTEAESFRILSEAKKDSIGLSNVLSKKYGITREEYFNKVWDIDPSGVVNEFEESVFCVEELS